MSADNGVYILKSKDGYRVAHAQAIENLYWWRIYTCDCKIGSEEEWCKCKKCGAEIKNEQREEINPIELKYYFGHCKVFKDVESALKEANRLFEEIISDPICPICEYGISYVRGWEKKKFPK